MLSEPTVLAKTKESIFSKRSSDNSDIIQYATVDTQFQQDCWPNAGPINEETKEILTPFNHVRIGSGYPDMVVAGPPPDFLEGFNINPDTVPVIAVEAKGETKDVRGTNIPVTDALFKAHDRLSESNAAIAAIPTTALSGQAKQLARDLNIGLIGVDTDGVSISVPPVPKGVDSDETADAVRWRASAQRVADQSFHYNHPKTYLGIPLAIAADSEMRNSFQSTIAKSGFSAGKKGARTLGLIQTGPMGEPELTPLGREVVRYGIRTHGDIHASLDEMSNWGGRGSRTDLIDRHEGWGELTRNILFRHPATPFIVETIEELTSVTNDGPKAGPTLPELVQGLHKKRPAYTVELFCRGNSEARSKVLTEDGSLSSDALETTRVYQSTTVYQYKMMLRHSGILHPDVTGNSTDKLIPTEDYWTLRTTISNK
ncbi:hypothetical protein [Halobacteriaceae bacterium SHR40]|uniref:hypothetical protein n=1 Tax=Halovenus amylolytica TaxID=2500550 RepID=UPI000FE330BB